uniref:YbaN family protein n=1 Tax=Holdemanella porci TaxID=2652276 RepID=UPI002DD881F3|nr:YbaN family protein [Holdemanella porci]
MISVILPILPTVPFVLLAAFCFAKTSEKLDGWFKNTKLYKDNNMKNDMTKQAKVRIMCSVTLLTSIGFIMMGLKGIVVGNIVLLIVWIFHMVYFTFGVKTV